MRTGDIPGVSVGKSILKLADKSSLGALGRAAKLALATDENQTITHLLSADKTDLTVVIIPFSPSGGLPDHLLIQISDAIVRSVFAPQSVSPEAKTEPPVADRPHTEAVLTAPTPSSAATDQAKPTKRSKTAARRRTPKSSQIPAASRPAKAKPTPKTPTPKRPKQEVVSAAETPPTGPLRETMPLPTMPDARDMIFVADAQMLPIAKALATVLKPTVKAKALPLGKFVSIFEGRAGKDAPPDKLETQLDPATRVVFLGRSTYGAYIRENSLRSGRTGAAGWAISGRQVRCSTIWAQSVPKTNVGDLIGDAQFDIGQICYMAVPKKRNGRRQTVAKGLELAGAFLEAPETIVTHRTDRDEAKHTLILLAVARWLKEGFELFLAP